MLDKIWQTIQDTSLYKINMEQGRDNEIECVELQRATIKWLEFRLSSLQRKLSPDDPRINYFEYLKLYFDKISICVNRIALQEENQSLKFGLDDGHDINKQDGGKGFIFPLTESEATNIQRSIPNEMFKALCLLGIQRTLDMFEKLNKPLHMARDAKKLNSLKEQIEQMDQDDPKLKSCISFYHCA